VGLGKFKFILTGVLLVGFGAAGIAARADVPPEVLREELAESISFLFADEIVAPGELLFDVTVKDAWLGYRVIALVDKSAPGTSPAAQSLTAFYYDKNTGRFAYLDRWPVSTGLETPHYKDGRLISLQQTRVGFYRAEYLDANYVSKSYREPMPHSVFYDRDFGTAIHATAPAKYPRLGKRASKGCTRLTEENARIFFDLIQSYGYGAVVKLDWRTGQAGETPRVVRGYRAFVINTEPGNPQSNVKIQPDEYRAHPERLRELLPRL
jgi:hypothetical protein